MPPRDRMWRNFNGLSQKVAAHHSAAFCIVFHQFLLVFQQTRWISNVSIHLQFPSIRQLNCCLHEYLCKFHGAGIHYRFTSLSCSVLLKPLRSGECLLDVFAMIQKSDECFIGLFCFSMAAGRLRENEKRLTQLPIASVWDTGVQIKALWICKYMYIY